MRTRVLVVAMLNSIHTARWLSQFEDRDLEIHLFPSTYYETLHPQIEALIKTNSKCDFVISRPVRFQGYLDYLQNRALSKIFNYFTRVERLDRKIKKVNPDKVHALEFQHAGYLCLEVINRYGKNFELISTNWGSDIYYFQKHPDHARRISQLLELTDKYSAECSRDIDLASKFGYQGEILPLVPNSGGFPVDSIVKERSATSQRKLVLVKSYGGLFGRSNLVLEIIPALCQTFPEVSFYLYSLTDDLVPWVQELLCAYPDRIKYSTVSNPLDYQQLQSLFDAARVYIGCSVSDGISTSFLESLVSGAYPVQTNTSCADEWVKKGAVASLVSLDSDELLGEVSRALSDDYLVDTAQSANRKIAIDFLDSDLIAKAVQIFY